MITKFYEDNLTWDDRITSIIGKNHSEIDSNILERSPKLSFNSDGKINIDIMYPPENEIREDSSPYDEYYQCIINTFDLSEIETFCDIGCATGHLVHNMVNDTDSCCI